MKSLYFLGSKPIGYHCLRHLIEQREILDIEIRAVVSRENPHFDSAQSLARLCNEHRIRLFTEVESLLAEDDVDCIISVQHHEILRARHIAKARDLAVNLHMAPLPEYRGCNQFSFAIVNGDVEFGTTIHRLEEGVDSGDIICERRFPIPKDCFVGELYDLTFRHSVELFQCEIGNIIDGRCTFTSQASLLSTRTSSFHYRKDIDDLKKIDLDWPGDRIGRHIRATLMPGFAPPYAMIGGRRVSFTMAEADGRD